MLSACVLSRVWMFRNAPSRKYSCRSTSQICLASCLPEEHPRLNQDIHVMANGAMLLSVGTAVRG
jgi:hypothetical protein